MIENLIGPTWSTVVGQEFQKDYLRKLAGWLSQNRATGGKTIYPDSEDVFKAFKLCPFDKVKVVIIGKEPYYQGNADGLAFSYKNGERKGQGMQSLDVILDEIENDCYNGLNLGRDYQLDYLAQQGVLLLNSVLTVFRGTPDSHKGFGWEIFTTKVVQALIEERTPKVFLLWGNDAQAVFETAKRAQYFPYWDHCTLIARHPAYDLHKRDQFGNIVIRYPEGFTGCKHFSQANQFLLSKGIGAIDWYAVEVLRNQPPF